VDERGKRDLGGFSPFEGGSATSSSIFLYRSLLKPSNPIRGQTLPEVNGTFILIYVKIWEGKKEIDRREYER
jgi:hypothetical protein